MNKFDPNDPIGFDTTITHVREYADLNFHACKHKYCFYGTNDRFKFNRHESYCRDSTKMQYKQVKCCKPENTIAKQLFDDGTLPTLDFENFFCVTYDVERNVLYIPYFKTY